MTNTNSAESKWNDEARDSYRSSKTRERYWGKEFRDVTQAGNTDKTQTSAGPNMPQSVKQHISQPTAGLIEPGDGRDYSRSTNPAIQYDAQWWEGRMERGMPERGRRQGRRIDQQAEEAAESTQPPVIYDPRVLKTQPPVIYDPRVLKAQPPVIYDPRVLKTQTSAEPTVSQSARHDQQYISQPTAGSTKPVDGRDHGGSTNLEIQIRCPSCTRWTRLKLKCVSYCVYCSVELPDIVVAESLETGKRVAYFSAGAASAGLVCAVVLNGVVQAVVSSGRR